MRTIRLQFYVMLILGLAFATSASAVIAPNSQKERIKRYIKVKSKPSPSQAKIETQPEEKPVKFSAFASDVGVFLGLESTPTTEKKTIVTPVTTPKVSKKPEQIKKRDDQARELFNQLRKTRVAILARQEDIPQGSYAQAEQPVDFNVATADVVVPQKDVDTEVPSAIELESIYMPEPINPIETLDRAFTRFQKEQGIEIVKRPSSGSFSAGSRELASGREDRIGNLADTQEEKTSEVFVADSKGRQKFDRTKDDLLLMDLDLQFVDERSDWEGEAVYPVSGLNIRIVGTGLETTTNSMGQVRFEELADRSRYLVSIVDPEGRFYPTIKEFYLDESNQGIRRVQLTRKFSLEQFENTASTQQRADRGSLCGTANDRGNPVKGIEVGTDVSSEGAYYFNEYGFLDPALNMTTENGRFCIFNIHPGMSVVRFTESGRKKFDVPFANFAGIHREENFNVSGISDFNVHLGLVGAANDQLANSDLVANRMTSVNYVDLIPLGEDDSLSSYKAGLVESRKPLIAHDQRLWLYTYGPTFEPTVQSQELNGPRVASLVPRGLMEDMALRAQVPFDHSQGHVLVEFGHWTKIVDDVDFKLFDHKGKEISKAWYFSGYPVSKGIFFNLKAGQYILTISNASGILSADTLLVYDRATTYAILGNRVIVAPGQ